MKPYAFVAVLFDCICENKCTVWFGVCSVAKELWGIKILFYFHYFGEWSVGCTIVNEIAHSVLLNYNHANYCCISYVPSTKHQSRKIKQRWIDAVLPQTWQWKCYFDIFNNLTCSSTSQWDNMDYKAKCYNFAAYFWKVRYINLQHNYLQSCLRHLPGLIEYFHIGCRNHILHEPLCQIIW